MIVFRRWTLLLAICALALLVPRPASAHDRTTSYSAWVVAGREATVTLRLGEVQIRALDWARTAAADFDSALAAYATQHLLLRANGKTCALKDGPARLPDAPDRLALRWSRVCPAQGQLRVHSDLLLDSSPSHLHFVRIAHDGSSAEQVLSHSRREWSLRENPAREDGAESSASVASYIALGVEHIVTGYDHLVFLGVLLLAGGSLASLAKVVTGFTLAHSLTLALSALGLVRPAIAPVEALIGLSIALVALENVWLLGSRRWLLPAVAITLLLACAAAAAFGIGLVSAPTFLGLSLFAACYYALLREGGRVETARWAVAFVFGLIHGFGFASVLQEAELPSARLAAGLFGFNVGVELGQLALVGISWPLLRYVSSRWGSLVVELGSALAMASGLYWFASRSYG